MTGFNTIALTAAFTVVAATAVASDMTADTGSDDSQKAEVHVVRVSNVNDAIGTRDYNVDAEDGAATKDLASK